MLLIFLQSIDIFSRLSVLTYTRPVSPRCSNPPTPFVCNPSIYISKNKKTYWNAFLTFRVARPTTHLWSLGVPPETQLTLTWINFLTLGSRTTIYNNMEYKNRKKSNQNDIDNSLLEADAYLPFNSAKALRFSPRWRGVMAGWMCEEGTEFFFMPTTKTTRR